MSTSSNPPRHETGPANDQAVGAFRGMATVPELAASLEISRTTAYRWIREKKLVAWGVDGEIKGPVDQVLGPRKPLPALAEIAEMLNMPLELVWDFLINPWQWAGQPPEAPLQKLKRGEIETVLDAAPAYLSCMG